MNQHMEDHKYPQKPDSAPTTPLESRLAETLAERASHIHFTPDMRLQVMQRISQRRQSSAPTWLIVFLACLLFLIISSSTLFFINYGQQAKIHSNPTISYTIEKFIPAPDQLAQGGQLVSLDPTGQHLVYQPAQQPGVMYMADLNDPIQSNVLVMRYAHDIAWSPDGSALVTTVSPTGSSSPLLALVPQGKYMYSLGQTAEAASWLPTSSQQIVYITHSLEQTHLWSTTPAGQKPATVATMDTPLQVLHLAWSHSGHELVLVVSSPSTGANIPQQAIYLMNAQTKALQQLISPEHSSFSEVVWSPDQQYLTYAETDMQGHTTLRLLATNTARSSIPIPLQHSLMGWSWSPDSRTLVYSDGGVLKAYTLRGPGMTFPTTAANRIDPFWLPNGNLLYVHITNGTGKLAILQAVKNH